MATAQQIIDRIRLELGDTFQPYRFGSPELLNYIRAAEIDIGSKRPDSLYTGETISTSLPSPHLPAITSNISLRDVFHMSVIYFVCAKAMMNDAEHAANLELAKEFDERYIKSLV